MSYRITRKHLVAQLAHAAQAANWDIAQPIWTREGDDNIARVGAVFLEHNTYYGWRLCQMVGEGGGERIIYSCDTPREMNAWLRGVVTGVGIVRRDWPRDDNGDVHLPRCGIVDGFSCDCESVHASPR